MFAKYKNSRLLPALMVLLGFLGAVQRVLLEIDSIDEGGLLEPWSIWGVLLLGLTLLAVALAFGGCRAILEAEGYQRSFPGSLGGFFGHGLGALGIWYTVWPQLLEMEGPFGLVWKVLGFASVICLGLGGFARYQGNKPNFLLHLCPTVFLMLHAVLHYRSWSSDPQLFHYGFQLLGLVCLILFSFYHAAFDVGMEWRRHLTFYALLSITVGPIAAVESEYPWLYAGFAAWALLDRPAPAPRRRRQPRTEESEE